MMVKLPNPRGCRNRSNSPADDPTLRVNSHTGPMTAPPVAKEVVP